MTFLKKLGQLIVKGIGIVSGFLPVLQATMPGSSAIIQTVSKDLAAIGDIVIQVEAMGAALGLSGADKLRAAVGPATQVLLQSELLLGKPISDITALNGAAQDIINGVVKMLNAVHPSAAVETPVPAAPNA